MDNQHTYFFIPRKGVNYERGFDKLKTLVVGIMHICTDECAFHDTCKTPQGVRQMDRLCPCYKDRNDDYYTLSNSNEIEIESFIEQAAKYPCYSAFCYYMLKKKDSLPLDDRQNFWDSVAFTNYLQIFNDSDEFPEEKEIYEEAFAAFQEVLEELQPDVIFIWNERVKNELLNHPEVVYYIGETDMPFQLSVYAFTPMANRLKGEALSELCKLRGIKTQKPVNLKWYKDIVREHIGRYIEEDAEENIVSIAKLLRELCDKSIIIRIENGFIFAAPEYVWKDTHAGVFARKLKDKYKLGYGVNRGLSNLFNKNISKCTNDSSRLAVDDKLLKIIEAYFPKERKNSHLK